MRDYSRFSSTFWTRGTGKELRGNHLAQAIAAYLFTAPTANMIGLYYLPVGTIAHDVGCSLEGACQTLRDLCERGFCVYDEESETVFVRSMAPRQLGLSDGQDISTGDKRLSSIPRMMKECSEPVLLQAFWEEHRSRLRLPEPWWEAPSRAPRSPFQAPMPLGSPLEAPPNDNSTTYENASPLEAPWKPHARVSRVRARNADQEQALEQAQAQGVQGENTQPNSEPSKVKKSDAEDVFTHWAKRLMPKARFTPERRKRIEARLKEDFSVADLCKAIDGALKDDWLMGRDPKSRKGGWRDIDTVLRDAAQVERLITLADEPEYAEDWGEIKPNKPVPLPDDGPRDEPTLSAVPEQFALALQQVTSAMKAES